MVSLSELWIAAGAIAAGNLFAQWVSLQPRWGNAFIYSMFTVTVPLAATIVVAIR